jgi:hypothetical protein
MTKRLHSGCSPLKQQHYKEHFKKIEDKTKKGKTNKKHRKA